MIKLEKGEEPQILKDNSVAWTEEIQRLLARDDDPTLYQRSRYNHVEVKRAIVSETKGKCAYCESKLLHVAHGDIEHIKPKKERPDLWFSWPNLTLACSVCNNKKRAYHDEALPLIDPYEDEPEGRLLFFGPLVRASIGDQGAEVTERVLDLNRPRLIERRTERFDHLKKLLDIVASVPDPLKNILREDFARELAEDKEYSAMSRAVAKQFGFEPCP